MIAHGLSTTMARKSFTLVKVGPGVKRSPSRAKKPVESLSARKAAGSRPAAWARATVFAVDDGAGGVAGGAGAAVGAVGVAGEGGKSRHAGKRDRQRQGIFLVGPAAALAADGDGQFAAREDDGAPPLRAERVRHGGMLGRHAARLALDPVAQ